MAGKLILRERASQKEFYTHARRQSRGSDVRRDVFSYVVQAGGRTSSSAEVCILVEEPAPRLRAPAALDFREIIAGEISTRVLRVENAGGGILSRRLTGSNPWVLAARGISDRGA